MSFASRPSPVQPFPYTVFGAIEQAPTAHQPGRVRALGTSWPAQLDASAQDCQLQPGQGVKAVARQGITMIVAPLS